MALKLKINKALDSVSVEAITSAVATVDPTLNVEVDSASQTITVQPKDSDQPVASEESIKQAVTAADYPVQG
jgi:copper chaperone CopZ